MTPEYGRTLGDGIAAVGTDLAFVAAMALWFILFLIFVGSSEEEEPEGEVYRRQYYPSNLRMRRR